MKNPNRAFKDAIYEQFARIGKAVSSPKRLELLDLLCQGPRSGRGFGQRIRLERCKCLPASAGPACIARLVEADKEGLYVIYRLADQNVCQFFRVHARCWLKVRLAEVEQIKRRFLEGREGNGAGRLREALLRLVREGAVTVLDVRPSGRVQRRSHPRSLIHSS